MSAHSEAQVHGIAKVLRSIRHKGVSLWAENGQLRYRGPKGVLSADEIETLRLSKAQILALLEGNAGIEIPEPRIEARPRRDLAPVTFSQLAHLNHFRLSGQKYSGRSVRVVWSATRLHNALDIDWLRKSLAEIVRRHDALRTRVRVLDGALVQSISKACEFDLQWVDLTQVPEDSREAEAECVIERFILEPVDRTTDALLAVRVLRLRHGEHIMIVAMDHAISDGTSINILVRELLTAYTQMSKGTPVSLPAVSMQFSDYAAWQRGMAGLRIAKQEVYWREHFAGCSRVRFPEDRDSVTNAHVGWGAVTVRIDRELKTALSEWCRARGTTLVLGAYAAYVGLVLRWCGVSDCVMQYQFNGRISPQLENTIGFLASPLYLRVRLDDSDSLLDLLHAATDEYCQAYEHADFYYLASQASPPEFTCNPLFNWTPLGSRLDFSGIDGAGSPIRCSPLRIPDPIRKPLAVDHEPILRLCDADEVISGDLFFPLDRFSTPLMERFARNFLMFLQSLIERPDQPVKRIQLVQ